MSLDDFPGGETGAALGLAALVLVLVMRSRGGVSTAKVVSLPGTDQTAVETARQSALGADFQRLTSYAQTVDVTRITGATSVDQARIASATSVAVEQARQAGETARTNAQTQTQYAIANANAQANKNIARAKDNTSLVGQVFSIGASILGHFL